MLQPSPKPYEISTAVVTLNYVPVKKLIECMEDHFPPYTLVSIIAVSDNASTPVKGRSSDDIPVSHRKYKVQGIMKVEVLQKGDIIENIPHANLVPYIVNGKSSFYPNGSIARVKDTFTFDHNHMQTVFKRNEEIFISDVTTAKKSKVYQHTSLSAIRYSVRKIVRVKQPVMFRSDVWVLHKDLALPDPEGTST